MSFLKQIKTGGADLFKFFFILQCPKKSFSCLFVGLVLKIEKGPKVFFSIHTYVVYFPILDTIPAGR